MASGFYVKRGEKEQGPFSAQDLKKFAASGKLKKTDKIRKQNSKQYVPATKVKGLFASVKPQTATKKRQPARKSPREFAGAEVIEEPAEVYDDYDDFGSPDDFDDYDDYGEVEDYGEIEEYDEIEDDEPEPPPKPRSRKRSRGGTPPPRRRPSRKKAGPAGKSTKKRKPVKKSADDEDEDDDGPWANLFYGLGCVVGGVLLFIALGEGSPDDWGRRGGLIKLVVQGLYYVGGRWAVLVVFVLLSLLFFTSAFRQFQEQ